MQVKFTASLTTGSNRVVQVAGDDFSRVLPGAFFVPTGAPQPTNGNPYTFRVGGTVAPGVSPSGKWELLLLSNWTAAGVAGVDCVCHVDFTASGEPLFGFNDAAVVPILNEGASVRDAYLQRLALTNTSQLPAAKIYNTAPIPLASSTSVTALPMAGEFYDVGGIHSPTVNPSRITVSAPGVYHLIAAVIISAPAGTAYLEIQKNGTATVDTDLRTILPAGARLKGAAQDLAVAGDYYEVRVWQASGAAASVATGAAWFSASAVPTSSPILGIVGDASTGSLDSAALARINAETLRAQNAEAALQASISAGVGLAAPVVGAAALAATPAATLTSGGQTLLRAVYLPDEDRLAFYVGKYSAAPALSTADLASAVVPATDRPTDGGLTWFRKS